MGYADSLRLARVRRLNSSLQNRRDRSYGRIRDKMVYEVVRERSRYTSSRFPANRHARVRFPANVDTDQLARSNCGALSPVEASAF